MKRLLLGLAFIACGICSATSQAAVIGLFDYRLNVDGVISYSSPGVVSLAGFDTTTGLGTITATFTGTGSHYIGVFLDHEIDEATNTFLNELGSVSGIPASGLTWEIDEPGFVSGNIFTNFSASMLDNTNSSTSPDDVSMALAWSFSIAMESATILWTVSETAPSSGFYLTQTDPDSNNSIYFSSSLNIVPTGGAVPEPSSWLVILGLVGASLKMRRKIVNV